jgi:hypothetical protein
MVAGGLVTRASDRCRRELYRREVDGSTGCRGDRYKYHKLRCACLAVGAGCHSKLMMAADMPELIRRRGGQMGCIARV